MNPEPTNVLEPGESWVELYNGQLSVVQHEVGYRLSLEAMILAHASRVDAGSLIEIGTGSGVIAASLALFGRASRIVAVEIQAAMARRARMAFSALDVQRSSAEDRVQPELVHADARVWAEEHSGIWESVICNPPYFKVGSGALAPNTERAHARHELTLDLPQMLAAAKRLLAPRGRFRLTYPGHRLAELFSGMRFAGIEPRELRVIHNAPGQPGKTVLVMGVSGARPELHIQPPLLLRASGGSSGNERGGYTPEMQSILAGAWE